MKTNKHKGIDPVVKRLLDRMNLRWEVLEGDLTQRYHYYRFFRDSLTRQFGVEGSDDQQHSTTICRFQMLTEQTLQQFHDSIDGIERLMANRYQ